MLTRPTVIAGAIEIVHGRGDVLNLMEAIFADATAAGITYDGRHVSGGIVDRSGQAGNVNDTLPTAQAMIQYVQGMLNQNAGTQLPGAASIPLVQQYPQWATMGLERDSSMRMLTRNLGGFQITLLAPASSGVLISGAATLATLSQTEWLVQFLATQTAYSFVGDPQNASPNINNVLATDLDRLAIGMSLYGANSGAGAVIQSLDYANNRVVASVNNTATVVGQATPATPTVRWTRLRTSAI